MGGISPSQYRSSAFPTADVAIDLDAMRTWTVGDAGIYAAEVQKSVLACSLMHVNE
jgi:energy-converting hydrogenase Eha subunit A